jgi:hypothetical protein
MLQMQLIHVAACFVFSTCVLIEPTASCRVFDRSRQLSVVFLMLDAVTSELMNLLGSSKKLPRL